MAKQETVTVNLQPLLMPVAIVVSALFLSIAMVIAGNSIGNGLSGATIGTVAGTTTDTTADTVDEPVITTASIDDDAILGNKDAKVFIIEFSDYECPYCKRFRDETLDEIKETYIDTDQVALVFRDLPLSFHDPAATFAANVMECARKQGGDAAYWEMHDFWFANTGTNGTGITDAKIKSGANALGLNGKNLLNCADNEEFADEIAADLADANTAGISGTPGFIVGVRDGDSVTGEVISGAYPFSEFERVIEQYL